MLHVADLFTSLTPILLIAHQRSAADFTKLNLFKIVVAYISIITFLSLDR